MRLKNHLDRIEERLVRLDGRQDTMEQTLAALRVVQERQAATMERQQEILDEHIRRSIANEEMLKLMREEGRDVVRWSFLGKALATLGALVGLVSGVLKLLGKS